MYSWPSRSRQVVWKSLQWSRLKTGSQCNLVVGGWTESQSNSGAVQHIRFVVVSCHSTIINNTTKKVESLREGGEWIGWLYNMVTKPHKKGYPKLSHFGMRLKVSSINL